jgi:2-polyprenyl-3-methyl-5-hydroxy-6-metoxy-1,4-benzoquinol methylase
MKTLLQNLGYVLDSETNVWLSPSYKGIAYNDGDEIETRIASIIKNATDISTLSTELRQHCTDWPSQYHLTSARANIMRPFEQMLNGANVLEIGAGCGAISRYLGECGAQVLALEGSPRRASIARSRTRDLDNITVLAEKFDQFTCEHQFDVITLIGVLEYANLFTPGDYPALTMLERVRRLLKPDGHLIIAIENQLGLKYFAGAPEDHLGQPMIGIEGRYGKDQPQTFGRKILAELIVKAGFESSNFFAPFPDYKLPVSIVTEAGFANKNFDAAAFAWQSALRDPQLPIHCNFSLELAWPVVVANELGLDVSNSFLVVASNSYKPPTQAVILAYHYSASRVAEYCKETVFSSSGVNDDVVVHSRRMGKPSDVSDIGNPLIKFVCPDTDKYILGSPLSLEFIRIVTQDGWSFDQVGKFVRNYLSIVEAEVEDLQFNLASPAAVLPGKYFDYIPQNIIVDANKNCFFIDKEWHLIAPIERAHLLFRSLLFLCNSITRFGRPASGEALTNFQFIERVFAVSGMNFQKADYVRFAKLESSIQHAVSGIDPKDFFSVWKNRLLPMSNMSHVVIERDKEIANLHQNIMALHNSTSWRITAPLRYIAERIKKLTGY